jgi:iron complex outermembrane receptor protein
MDFALRPSAVHLDEVVTTGTRALERTATESAAPIDVISGSLLESTGAVETWQQLEYLTLRRSQRRKRTSMPMPMEDV